jgi:hypothetical protein
MPISKTPISNIPTIETPILRSFIIRARAISSMLLDPNSILNLNDLK